MIVQGAKFEFVQAQLQSEHPAWSATKIFEQAAAQCNQRGGFARTPLASLRGSVAARESAETSVGRVDAKSPTKQGQDPAIADELQKHKTLRESRQTAGVTDHVARLQKIRALITANPPMDWDSAFSQICRDEMQSAVAAKQAAVHPQTRQIPVKCEYSV